MGELTVAETGPPVPGHSMHLPPLFGVLEKIERGRPGRWLGHWHCGMDLQERPVPPLFDKWGN